MTFDLAGLVSRSLLEPPRFSAVLHEWADPEAQMKIAARLAEPTTRSKPAQWASQFAASQSVDQVSLDARIALALPDRYRIDYETDRSPQGQTIVSDGQRLWNVYADRVAVKDARPVPDGLSRLADLSWLLAGLELTGERAGTAGGRDAVLVTAVAADDCKGGHHALSKWPALGDEIEIAVDAELGIALSQRWKLDGQLVLSTELTEVGTSVDDEVFTFEAPPGFKVLDDPGIFAETELSAGNLAWQVTKGMTKMAFDVTRSLGRRRSAGGGP